jgi:hypothetical protein
LFFPATIFFQIQGLSSKQKNLLLYKRIFLFQRTIFFQRQDFSCKQKTFLLQKYTSGLAPFRLPDDLLAAVRYIAKGHTHADMIQDLNNLSVLGEANQELLTAIRFDMSLLDKAAQTAHELASLLAETNSCRLEYDKAKKIRDQAYTHLKEAVDEICGHGKYVFRDNKERYIGYRSHYIRQKRSKRASKSDAPEAKKK